MVFRGPLVNYIPGRWQRFDFESTDMENPPRWLWWFAVMGFLLVAYTWYAHFTSDIEHSWILGGILTISVLKLSQCIHNFRSLNRLMDDMTIEYIRRAATLNVFIVIGGAMLVYMGLFIY